MTTIGVPAASGLLIAAAAISSTLSSGAAAPTATAPAVSCKNFLRVTVSISTPMHSLHTQDYTEQVRQTLQGYRVNYAALLVCADSTQQHLTNQR